MKKPKMFAVLALVLAVAVSAFSVAGTYAKYTSTGTYSDSARVAKWGINLGGTTVNTINLFKDSYTDPTNTNTTVNGNGAKVIAPGTTNSYAFNLSTTGAPEVAYKVTFAIDEDNTSIPTDLEGKLLFSTTEDGTYSTLSALITALNNNHTADIAAGTALNVTDTIYWKWAFNGGDDSGDTDLGNADELANVRIAIKVTAEQVD